jgi:integrase
LAEELAAARPEDASDADYVAPGRFGQPLDLDNWRWRIWKPAAEKAGVKGTPGDCRHTFASLLANEGGLMQDVARQLGHTTPQMLDRYSEVFDPTVVRHRMPMADAIREARQTVERDVAEKRHSARPAVKKRRATKRSIAGVSR